MTVRSLDCAHNLSEFKISIAVFALYLVLSHILWIYACALSRVVCRTLVTCSFLYLYSLYHLPKGPENTFGLIFILVGVPTTDSMLPAYMFASLHDELHSVTSPKLHRKNRNCTTVVNPGAHTLLEE